MFVTLPEELLKIIVYMAADLVLNDEQITRLFDEAKTRAEQKATTLVKTKPIDGLIREINLATLN